MSRKINPASSEVSTNGLDEAIKLVGQITAIVGEVPALTAKERMRSIKLRKGGTAVIPTLAALSQQFGLTLTSHPVTEMVALGKKAATLAPLHRQMTTATKQITDQIFAANGASWAAATVHYTMLKRLAKTNGDLEAALAPIEQFFTTRSAAARAAVKAQRDARKAATAAKAAAEASPAAPSPTPPPASPASAGATQA